MFSHPSLFSSFCWVNFRVFQILYFLHYIHDIRLYFITPLFHISSIKIPFFIHLFRDFFNRFSFLFFILFLYYLLFIILAFTSLHPIFLFLYLFFILPSFILSDKFVYCSSFYFSSFAAFFFILLLIHSFHALQTIIFSVQFCCFIFSFYVFSTSIYFYFFFHAMHFSTFMTICSHVFHFPRDWCSCSTHLQLDPMSGRQPYALNRSVS